MLKTLQWLPMLQRDSGPKLSTLASLSDLSSCHLGLPRYTPGSLILSSCSLSTTSSSPPQGLGICLSAWRTVSFGTSCGCLLIIPVPALLTEAFLDPQVSLYPM